MIARARAEWMEFEEMQGWYDEDGCVVDVGNGFDGMMSAWDATRRELIRVFDE